MQVPYVLFFSLCIISLSTCTKENENDGLDSTKQKIGLVTVDTEKTKRPSVAAGTETGANIHQDAFPRVPQNLITGLKAALDTVRERQQQLLRHLECSLSEAKCKLYDRMPANLDWFSLLPQGTEYATEIDRIFKENSTQRNLPTNVIPTMIEMFNRAVTQMYVTQRFIADLLATHFSTPAVDPKRKDSTLKETRNVFNFYEWLASLFQPLPGFQPAFLSPNRFADKKPCYNDTMTGTFNNGTGFYYSSVIQWGSNCSQFVHHVKQM